MSFVTQILTSLFLGLQAILPIQLKNLPAPIRNIIATPTPTATPTPIPTPSPIPTLTPTPAPVGGFTAVVAWQPRYLKYHECPPGVSTYSVPPCYGLYPNYPVYIRDAKTNQVVFSGRTDSGGYIKVALPTGSYYWVPNEAGTEPGDRRDFSVTAGVWGNYMAIFLVEADIGVPSPTPMVGCGPGYHEKIIPPDWKVCERD